MISKELELELKLTQLNNKIIFYDKLFKKLPFGFRPKFMLRRLQKIINERDSCFRELRELIRKKHPEKFIRSNNE